jgi:hypothetical protein
MKKLINLTQEVKSLLEKRPALRDSNRKLCIAIWKIEAKKKKLEPSFFFENYERGALSCADNIVRLARLLKAENKELRGNNHVTNQKKALIGKKIFKKK